MDTPTTDTTLTPAPAQAPSHAPTDALSGRLVLVRHGQTDWNKAGRMQGSSDIPLNDTGREQALAAGEAVLAAASPGRTWTVLASSPLGRARETAELVGRSLGLDRVETVPDIIERHYGEAEGKVLTYEESRHPEEIYAGVESEESVYRRAVAALKELVLAHPGEDIVAVSHGSTIRRVLIASTPGDWSAAIPNAEPIEVDVQGLFAWTPADLA